ncbi:MAG TPA: hypothetical protein VFE47_01870 [Tepidisphaeraceae bacterium]|jgi:hypothetical protein|nr:hypothetical protein [Tepidisphaeraceae bacterium]
MPAALLIIAVSITFAAAVAERIWIRRYRQRLQKLAGEWGTNYSPHDQFRLTPRVFANFPIPGAANVRVVDVLYYIDHDRYCYIFTAEYTSGIVTGKRRVRRAATLSEPRERAAEAPAAQITLAPANLPLVDQYRKLRPVDETH